MRTFTPEERKEFAAKAHATARRNREAAQREREAKILEKDRLHQELLKLRRERGELHEAIALSEKSRQLTGKYMLTESEIVAASKRMEGLAGVYFLVRDGRVIYCGQSVNVPSRVSQHHVTGFDAVAWIPCKPDILDALESLYIHVLKPPLNGSSVHGGKSAPMRIDALLHNLLEG